VTFAAANPETLAELQAEHFTEYLNRVMLGNAPLKNPKDVAWFPAWFPASYTQEAKANGARAASPTAYLNGARAASPTAYLNGARAASPQVEQVTCNLSRRAGGPRSELRETQAAISAIYVPHYILRCCC
jgi:hypothetical protein